jgi:hypothetical protein
MCRPIFVVSRTICVRLEKGFLVPIKDKVVIGDERVTPSEYIPGGLNDRGTENLEVILGLYGAAAALNADTVMGVNWDFCLCLCDSESCYTQPLCLVGKARPSFIWTC